MFRKIIAAAALAASAAIAVAPSAAFAQDRDHRSWQAQGNHGGQRGGRWIDQGGYGQNAYNPRYNGYQGNGGAYNDDRFDQQQRRHGSDQRYNYDQNRYYQNGYGGHGQDGREH